MTLDELISSWDYELLCDSCGHRVQDNDMTYEQKKSAEGSPCDRPWCDGHYKFIDMTPYNTSDNLSRDEIRRNIIKKEFFPLPTFDKDAYREECLLVKKEQEEAYERRHRVDPATGCRIDDQGVLHCPKCYNAEIKEISTVRKAASVLALGLASPKIGKRYRCLGCGHTW